MSDDGDYYDMLIDERNELSAKCDSLLAENARLKNEKAALLSASKKVLVGCDTCGTSSKHYQKNERGEIENIGQDCARCYFGVLKAAVAKAEESEATT